MIERLATWYLRRRGVVVLPRAFLGIAVGYCHVRGTKDNMLVLPISPNAEIIALNHSIIDVRDAA